MSLAFPSLRRLRPWRTVNTPAYDLLLLQYDSNTHLFYSPPRLLLLLLFSLSPNKFMPAFEVDRVCRKKGSLPVAQHLPVMKVPLPCTGDDCQGSRSPLQFARDQAKQEAKDRMDAGWEKYMDGK